MSSVSRALNQAHSLIDDAMVQVAFNSQPVDGQVYAMAAIAAALCAIAEIMRSDAALAEEKENRAAAEAETAFAILRAMLPETKSSNGVDSSGELRDNSDCS